MTKSDLHPTELFLEYPDIMTVHDVRAALGIGRKGVYNLLESGKIRCFKIGNTYTIPKTALIEFVNVNAKGGATK